MVVKISRFFLLGFVLVVGVLLSSGIVGAECFDYHGNSSGCGTANCIWEAFANGGDWCGNDIGCCEMAGCWQWDGTNLTVCENTNASLNCTWDPLMIVNYPNNDTVEFEGMCMGIMGGFDSGCWNYDGDEATCISSSNTALCSWAANGANQNPWCWNNVGCCEQKGCWSHDGNQGSCEAAFQGNCLYSSEGWCNAKFCSEIATAGNCSYVQENLFMPCGWNVSGGETCEAMGGGGFSFYDDNSDTCFSNGGWYNSTGSCVMPTDGGGMFGGGGFMFGGGAHCWFADNQPLVCGNITGCAYCNSTVGIYGTTNGTDNICHNAQVGYCEGHVAGDTLYSNANNSANLACTDINLKSACKYGPLPNCIWNSSVNSTGAFCAVGTTSDKKAEPPVPFCEHQDSKNNYSLCMQLINDFMMPCKWDNSSTIVKNCTFNSGAVFGSGGGTDIGGIGSKSSCTSAGGTWQTENYVDENILKQDSWCEMTGFLSVDDGGGKGNKANCDTSCWACEFQNNGTAWATSAIAEAECVGSALSYCKWTNDTTNSSFNKLGWCDYPKEMEVGGSGDCNMKCEDCDFMNNPSASCVGSVADCQWVNDTNNIAKGGYCVNKAKKVCTNDCFSCYDVTACQNSAINCSWDSWDNLCSPDGYSGEICFNGKDDDGDKMIDCGDPDCGFDNFCGGAVFGGDCFAKTTKGTCNQTNAFVINGVMANCSWMNDTWNSAGWCDMPGANCWKFDDNMTACGEVTGCSNDSTSMGMGSMCDMNITKMDSANCWSNSNESSCTGSCQWVNDTWCAGDGNATAWCIDPANVGAGWCDYKPFADCMGLNSSTCGTNGNCSWELDSYSEQGGMCNVACFNDSLDVNSCNSTSLGNICEWRDMSATCQPSTFMMMGTGAGGKTGCWQYDGNETACALKNITCQYKNDSYAQNNVSVGGAPGFCMDKAEFQHFGGMEGGVVELAMDSGNAFSEGGPSAEVGVSGEVDLMGMGMRVSDEGFNFGAGVFNMSKSIICNGYMVGAKMVNTGVPSLGVMGAGNASGSFYWYLDTDGFDTGGCNATNGSVNYEGYDFMVSYVGRNTTAGVVETKQLMRCASGTWTATNALVTTSKKMSCGEIGGVMIALSKQDLESFANYNKTADMRIFMASANGTGNRTNPSDYLGPGYYTKGMIDFGFVDCSNPNTKDSKCKNMQKFGFNVFEECMNGVDDDENGLTDCNDPMCLFMPKCAGVGNAFAFGSNTFDKTAPTVMFSKVEKLSDAAFMKIDTNEPSSLNVTFYGNDSSCAIPNITLTDTGSEAYQAYAKFKPFHSVDLTEDTIHFLLEKATTYYYKIKVCDPSDNCAVSACSNFTTRASLIDKQFIFKLDLPDGYTVDIPALNKTGYNFTQEFNISGVPTTFDVGIKTNTSVTKNMNFTVHSNCGDGLSIGFYGVNVFEPLKVDMTNAFVCNEATNMMGMNSSLKKWNTLIDDMHLGGANDYVQIEMPVAYSSANTFNYVDDAGANAAAVDNYVNCSGTTTTVCKVPVSLGF